jgi:hypothetical protein
METPMDRLQELTLPAIAVLAVVMAAMAGWGLMQARALDALPRIKLERVVVQAGKLVPAMPVPGMVRRSRLA